MAELNQITLPVKDTTTGTIVAQLFDIKEKSDVRHTTLVAGATYVDFPNVSGNVLVDPGTTLSSLEYNDIVPYGTGVRVTFDAQTSDVEIYLTVKEV